MRPPSSVISHLRPSADKAHAGGDYLHDAATTDWHLRIKTALQSADWEAVRINLEAHRLLAKDLDTERKEQDNVESGESSFWARLSNRFREEGCDRHGLLGQDSDGRTPLHLALSSKKTPNDVLLSMIRLEPSAASVLNLAKRSPLFMAVVHRHHIDVLAELIEADPSTLSLRDTSGNSPLSYAVDIAIQETDVKCAPRGHWMHADDDTDEARWQEEQGERWGHVHWLLLSSATHPQTSLSVGDDKPMLVDALLHSAPPAVISLLIGASTIFLDETNRAVAFAGSTMYTCIHRHYPQSILYSLAMLCPREVRQVRDETGMGLLSSQFLSACYEQNLDSGEWKTSPMFIEKIRRCILSGQMLPDTDLSDWWAKIKFLVAFCGGENPDTLESDFLLHVALTNSDLPPTIFQLLLVVFPDSLRLPFNRPEHFGALPVHLAAALPSYIPRSYENALLADSALDQILEAYPRSARISLKLQLPLHIAIEAGKVGAELTKLVKSNTKAVSQRDPVTQLFPFQQAAAFDPVGSNQTLRWICQARNMYSGVSWRGMSTKQKRAAVHRVARAEDLDRLGTIFELLRRDTTVLSPTGKNTNLSNLPSLKRWTMGNTASHYMSWCYLYEEETWTPNTEKMDEFSRACEKLSAGGTLNDLSRAFQKWNIKLRFWLKYGARGNTDIPSDTENYLLHASLAEEDIPADVVKLLLAIDSSAARRALPNSEKLPLHIVCENASYIPRHFETKRESSLGHIIGVYPNAANIRFSGRLPLHLGIDSAKPWDELGLLVRQHKMGLRQRDPRTGFFPFQQMALQRIQTQRQHLRFQRIAMSGMVASQWSRLSPREHASRIIEARTAHELGVLTSIYGLLRADPAVLDISTTFDSQNQSIKPSTPGGGKTPKPRGEQTLLGQEASHMAGQDDRTSPDTSSNKVSDAQRDHQGSLSRLLSASSSLHSKGPQQKNTNYELSVFSNIDVMSTISNLNESRRHPLTVSRRSKAVGPAKGDEVIDDSSYSSYEFAECSVSSQEDVVPNCAHTVEGTQESKPEEVVLFQLRRKPRELSGSNQVRLSGSRSSRCRKQAADSSHGSVSSSAEPRSPCVNPSPRFPRHAQGSKVNPTTAGIALGGKDLYSRHLLGGAELDSESEDDLLLGSHPSFPKTKELPTTSFHSLISEVGIASDYFHQRDRSSHRSVFHRYLLFRKTIELSVVLIWCGLTATGQINQRYFEKEKGLRTLRRKKLMKMKAPSLEPWSDFS